MPNWCTQRLKIEMLGERDTSREAEIIRSLFNDDGEGNEGDFDFNKIIPMPEELDNTESSSRVIPGLQYYVNTKIRETPAGEPIDPNFRSKINIVRDSLMFRNEPLIMSDQRFEELTISLGPSSLHGYFTIGEQCFNCLIKYGHTNWYNWRIANWGVKWNAANTYHNLDEGAVYFDTPWGPATQVIDELAEQYPECRIILDFAEEQVSEFAGHYVWENGERVVEDNYESDSRECYEMAFELGVADRDNYELIEDADTYRYKY